MAAASYVLCSAQRWAGASQRAQASTRTALPPQALQTGWSSGPVASASRAASATGATRIAKVPSTPSDPSRGFLDAVERILAEGNVAPDAISYLVHGTTFATNSIIEGKTPRTAFITTEGFRDMLEIGRQVRPTLYDVHFEKPRPLVPRNLCFEVKERLDATGAVLESLDEDRVHEIARTLADQDVVSVAVCLLHGYLNPVHERRIGELLRTHNQELVISLSSDVCPEFREYFRASTTIINACVRPVLARYLEDIESRLRGHGMTAELLIMQSSGGVLTFETGAEKPAYMVESGPAAGVIVANHIAGELGYANAISFDMGGTTAKVGLILDGQPKITKEYEVGAQANPGVGQARASGYPIRTPVIDSVAARFELALMYSLGHGVRRNYSRAAYWYRLLAEPETPCSRYGM